MNHVVNFSGGVGSYMAAKRVIAKYGVENTTLLFCDTLIEDEDLYRFLDDAEKKLGLKITRISEGRTPWELFFDEKMMGNSRVDLCSRVLKRELADNWYDANCDRSDTVCYVGIDWTEVHRFDDGEGRGVKNAKALLGWKYEAPMCDAPLLTKTEMLEELVTDGIATPRLYDMGFPHNNCGGFCVKAGQASFARLLQYFPDRYMEHAMNELAFRTINMKNVSIMRDRRDGGNEPMTLLEFKARGRIW